MPEAFCRQCGGALDGAFRFCPWCAAPLRSKLVEFFRSHPLIDSDGGRALRVSRYFGPSAHERHVRFSVWNEEGRAEAAVSLDDVEAFRLARFIAETTPTRCQRSLVDRLLAVARR